MNDLTLLLSRSSLFLLMLQNISISLFLQYSYKKNHYIYAFLCCVPWLYPSELSWGAALCVFEWEKKINSVKSLTGYTIMWRFVFMYTRECELCVHEKEREWKRQVPCKVILYLLFNNSNLIFSFLLFRLQLYVAFTYTVVTQANRFALVVYIFLGFCFL